MKKVSIIISILGLFLFPLAILAGGKDYGSPKVVILGEEEVIEHDYFAAGDRVEIFGTINGDAYIAAGEVIVDGVVNGDLLVAGGSVIISGIVKQDIRVAGGDVTVNVEVTQNITAVGGTIDINESAAMAGNLVIAGGDVFVNGPVEGNVQVAAGQAVFSDRVGGYVEGWVELLRLTPKAEIEGTLTYWSAQEASVDDGAVVGETTYNKVDSPQAGHGDFKDVFVGLKILTHIVGLITALVIGLLFVKFYPRFSKRVTGVIEKQPLASFGVGLVALVLLPVLAVVLMVTFFGLKLGFITLAMYAILVCIGSIFAMLVIGYWVARLFSKEVNLYWALVVGAVVFYILTLLPVIGMLLKVLALIFGIGGLLLAKKAFYNELKEKQLI